MAKILCYARVRFSSVSFGKLVGTNRRQKYRWLILIYHPMILHKIHPCLFPVYPSSVSGCILSISAPYQPWIEHIEFYFRGGVEKFATAFIKRNNNHPCQCPTFLIYIKTDYMRLRMGSKRRWILSKGKLKKKNPLYLFFYIKLNWIFIRQKKIYQEQCDMADNNIQL